MFYQILFIMMLDFLEKNDLSGEGYHGYLKRPIRRLKGGCKVFFLVNSVVVLITTQGKELNFGLVKKLVEAKDGKFMIVKKNHQQAVFSPDGKILADFAEQSHLFFNGWFIRAKDDGVSLFDEQCNCICPKILKALVFRDGKYFISAPSGSDATKVGFFNADGSRIIFSNDSSFKCLFPYLFIADGSLYSLNGKCLIEANLGSNFNRKFVRCIGALPFWKH